jgi:hypothetical protein
VIQKLAKTERRTRAQVVAAATELGYSRAQTYVLLNRFLADPRLTSLLPRKRGQTRGNSRLSLELDQLVDEAIETVYLSRQRPPNNGLDRAQSQGDHGTAARKTTQANRLSTRRQRGRQQIFAGRWARLKRSGRCPWYRSITRSSMSLSWTVWHVLRSSDPCAPQLFDAAAERFVMRLIREHYGMIGRC